jgi:predicted RNase H-like nuclease (RuvC/YqgF family)
MKRKDRQTFEATQARIAELRQEISSRQAELAQLAAQLEEFKWAADAELKQLATEGVKPVSPFA